MNLLIALFLIISEALYEGLHDRGKKTIAGVIEAIHRLFCIVVIFAWSTNYILTSGVSTDFWYILIGYTLFRFAIFDLIYNVARGNSLLFFGTTKLYDRIMDAILWKAGSSIVWFLKGIAFVWGVFWLLGWQNGILN